VEISLKELGADDEVFKSIHADIVLGLIVREHCPKSD